jgi:hypothetical protein
MMARRDIPDEMDVYRGYSKDGGEDHMSEDFKLEEPFIWPRRRGILLERMSCRV